MRKLAIALAALTAFTAPTQAAVILLDTFDTENGGVTALNYTGFANFTVNGQVDLVASGDYDITCTGSCVDLDGTNGPGELESASFAHNAGDFIRLSVLLGGSQRTLNGLDTLTYGFHSTSDGNITGTLPIASTDLFNIYNFDYVFTGSGTFYFTLGTTSADYVGPLVDAVGLELTPRPRDVDPVPEPATWAMMIGGFALVGSAMRRRKATVSFA